MRSNDSGWLTVNQACRRLGITRRRLFRLIDEGELPGYRIGHWIRLRVADVEAYLQERDDREE